MTSKQLKVLNELMEDESFKGKKSLKHLIWLNTTPPKFEVGKCYKVTDTHMKLFGHKVKNFNAELVEAYTFVNENEYYYKFKTVVKKQPKDYVTIVCVSASGVGEETDSPFNYLEDVSDVKDVETISI